LISKLVTGCFLHSNQGHNFISIFFGDTSLFKKSELKYKKSSNKYNPQPAARSPSLSISPLYQSMTDIRELATLCIPIIKTNYTVDDVAFLFGYHMQCDAYHVEFSEFNIKDDNYCRAIIKTKGWKSREIANDLLMSFTSRTYRLDLPNGDHWYILKNTFPTLIENQNQSQPLDTISTMKARIEQLEKRVAFLEKKQVPTLLFPHIRDDDVSSTNNITIQQKPHNRTIYGETHS
jgi:hypothetical protein